jgi:hypothetical protein
MTQLSTLPAPPRPGRRRWRIVLVLLAILFAGLAGTWMYLAWAEEREFQAAVAETDLLDPDWRYADLDRARAKIPDDSNSALQVLRWRRLGAGGSLGMLEEQIWATPYNVQFNPEQVAALHKYFEPNPKARALAHKLKDMPNGRFANSYDPATAALTLDWVQRPRELANYLQTSAFLAAQQEDAVQLADACRALINNARSIGDEPSLIAILVRVAIMEISQSPLERGLAQMELPPAELQAIATSLQRELDAPRLWWALRGERAMSMDMIEASRDGRLQRNQLVAGMKGWRVWMPSWLPIPVGQDRAVYLRGMNAVVEASKQPVEKQLDAIDRAIEQWSGRDWMLDGITPGCSKVTAAHIRNYAKLRCAATAIAAERYRQEHDGWPESLDAMVNDGQLKAVPLDPYDGQPLRYKRLADGVLFYSVGVDRTDNGGHVDRTNPVGVGVDLGFRLYDPAARRRPAR